MLPGEKHLRVRAILFAALLVIVAGIGAKLAWPEAVNAVFDDFYTWFHYFAGPIRRG
jgi:hypothetical protein